MAQGREHLLATTELDRSPSNRLDQSKTALLQSKQSFCRTGPALANIVSGSNSEMAFAMLAYCSCAGPAPSRHRYPESGHPIQQPACFSNSPDSSRTPA